MNEDPPIEVGQVWHFVCEDVVDCNDIYLLLRPLIGSSLSGLWEAFDLMSGEITFICPCVAGDWILM